MKFKPHPYQQHAIDHILQHPACGLFLDMGMGKTVITLTAAAELLHDRFEVSRVLVIAPKRVAEDQWTREAEKWDHTRYLRVVPVLGDERKRLAALRESADIYVISRENVEWLVQHYKRRWPFDMVVIDELSSFKSPTARRFRALRRVRPLVRRIVGLTGTPAPNGLIDLWAQMYLLDQGERLGKTVTGYRARYFEPAEYIAGGRPVRWRPVEGAERAIYAKLSDICVSMKAEDWLELPERIDNVVPVKLPKPARAAYDRLERDYVLQLGSADVVAANSAALTGKLLQLANGAVYDEAGGVQELHDAKLDALEDVIEAANGKPVLVFYSFKHDLERLRRRFPQARELQTSKDIAEWNAGRVPILLAHPASAGHGLNLQDGGNIVAWFGLTWSLELYQQANKRLHRQGQRERVIVNHIIAEGTVDEDVMAVLATKAATQDDLLEAVKARAVRYFRG